MWLLRMKIGWRMGIESIYIYILKDVHVCLKEVEFIRHWINGASYCRYVPNNKYWIRGVDRPRKLKVLNYDAAQPAIVAHVLLCWLRSLLLALLILRAISNSGSAKKLGGDLKVAIWLHLRIYFVFTSNFLPEIIILHTSSCHPTSRDAITLGVVLFYPFV